ncbi:MAG: 4Fe-4S dicluster domain-containing protein [Chloroflexi bacterium]|nr:4Fe-4S dicluster domain-containing protein [Chloroflexota bacterium]
MPNDHRPKLGSTIAIQKPVFNTLLARLREAGYQTIGPCIKNDTLVYDSIESINELPYGYISEQNAGRFRLIQAGHKNYFDVIPGAQSWKQFLFPPRVDLFALHKNDKGWETITPPLDAPAYAFIGVRACELAAIQIQDRIFMRDDFNDPIYRNRRKRAFILSVDCSNPAGTCFCVSMGTGPRVKGGFDLNLTELDDVFLLTIGSELALGLVSDLPFEDASAFMLSTAERIMDNAAKKMGRSLDISDLPELILKNLDDPYWQEIGSRCLSCANCTQVCPTCFCWDALDHMSLNGLETSRERVWDSCFNPGYSYQAGGNTRPTISSRYRQWLSHKLGTWEQQNGTLGCVGCGRCITWCPAEIDLTKEISILRKEASK